MKEVWKSIPGWRGYEASTLGRVRSVDRVVKYTGGADRRLRGKVLKILWRKRDGYGCVNFSRGGEVTVIRVHQIIARTFIGVRPKGKHVCHNNGKPSNNRPENLRYDTKSGNEADRIEHGTSNRGERCGSSKLKRRQVLAIRRIYEARKSTQQELASRYGVTRRTIGKIISGGSWSWL